MAVVSYEAQTRNAYDADKAVIYYDQINGKTWMRFTMWRELRCVRRAVAALHPTASDIALDLPCGTGLLAEIFRDLPCAVVPCDISGDMMGFAKGHYDGSNFPGLVQGDLAESPFMDNSFAFVITLGLMHRVPYSIRTAFLKELHRITSGHLIVSYSLDSPVQRLKKRLIRLFRPHHTSAPSPTRWRDIRREISDHGFTVIKRYMVFPVICSEVVLVLRKTA